MGGGFTRTVFARLIILKGETMTATSKTIDRIPLGASDLRVSPLGVGTNRWGSNGKPDPEMKTAFAAVLAAGINFFDTAEIYSLGGSERTLALCLNPVPKDVVIATKFMPLPWRTRKPSLADALKASLKRLGLPRVDLYMTHFPFPPISIETWMDALADAQQAGLTRAVGVSNYNVKQMRRAHAALAKRGVKLASNQVEYSLLKRGPERAGLLAACKELNVTLVAYRPLCSGLLSGKYSPENPPPGLRGLQGGWSTLKEIAPLINLLRETAGRHGKTPSQAALNWIICKGALPIPGAGSARHAEDNAGALGWRLSADEVAALDKASI
jgi:aryl-alcohol dehydrogenase-like predicted oxidoreductase